jgi:hypothetical protein
MIIAAIAGTIGDRVGPSEAAAAPAAIAPRTDNTHILGRFLEEHVVITVATPFAVHVLT